MKFNKEMIFVTGLPRSGTSWISSIITKSNKIKYYYEPDNEHNSILGYLYKNDLHRFPYFHEEEEANHLIKIFKKTIVDQYLWDFSKPAIILKKLYNISLDNVEIDINKKCSFDNFEDYLQQKPLLNKKLRIKSLEGLFHLIAFLTKKDQSKIPLVKSVHSVLSAPYIQRHIDCEVILIVRHPASIIASHIRLKNQDINRNLFSQKRLLDDYLHPFIDDIKSLSDPIEIAGAQVGAIYYVLSKQIERNPNWIVIHHEEYCKDPVQKSLELFNKIYLDWSSEIENHIHEMNKSGSGYTTNRIAKKQIDKWKNELTSDAIDKIKRGYNIFPHSFYKNFR